MEIELKILDLRLHGWGVPKYACEGDAGIDLRACIDSQITLYPNETKLIGSGIAVNISDPNVMMVVVPRSGLGAMNGIVLGNLVGIIDSGYHGEIKMMVWNRNDDSQKQRPFVINPGDRIMQAAFVPIVRPSFNIVENFSEKSTRGVNGFGHTGL